MVYSAFVTMLPYINVIHQLLFCFVGMCLFLPALVIAWICIGVGCLGLLMEIYFQETLEAISHYVKYTVPLWLLLTSVILLILHWPVRNDNKVFIP